MEGLTVSHLINAKVHGSRCFINLNNKISDEYFGGKNCDSAFKIIYDQRSIIYIFLIILSLPISVSRSCSQEDVAPCSSITLFGISSETCYCAEGETSKKGKVVDLSARLMLANCATYVGSFLGTPTWLSRRSLIFWHMTKWRNGKDYFAANALTNRSTGSTNVDKQTANAPSFLNPLAVPLSIIESPIRLQ